MKSSARGATRSRELWHNGHHGERRQAAWPDAGGDLGTDNARNRARARVPLWIVGDGTAGHRGGGTS